MNDAISRQAVDELSKALVHTTRDKADFLCNFWEGLQKLPPVNPQESKTGYWILKRTFPTKLYDEYLNEYKCSECYREIRCTESQLVNYPYCHCGARMIEPQESEEKE